MARAIDEKIVELKVNKDQFEANLRAAATAMSNLEKSINSMNTQSVDQPTSSFEKLKNTISSISINPIKNMFDYVQNGASKIGSVFGDLFKTNPFSTLSNLASSAVNAVTGIFGNLGRLNPFRNVATNASESFGSIEKSANSVNMAGLSSSVENLSSKFSLMGQVAQGAIQNIGATISNKLMGGWSTMLSGITGGYDEYTNKMKSIQVIMNNIDNPKLSNVKSTLNNLNNYADKTVYSFEDMTYNLGTFTAAGVKLKDAEVAIKGIGNLAAVSGSNTQQASTAMYQLSQALASGKVGLQDWNSVVNAGMGGQKFQKALSETAKELGHGRDESVSFRDSLQDGWLTSEVLLKTLNKFSKDKSMLQAATQVKSFSDLMDTTIEGIGSGWAQVWENIFGDVEQAPKLWTGVANAIGKPINAMSNYLINTSNEFNKLGGRAAVIQGLANVFSTLGKILGSIGDAFKTVFPPATGQQITNMAKEFEKLTENFKVSDSTLSKIKDTFSGFFAIIKLGMSVVSAIGGLLLKMVPTNLLSVILDVTSSIGRFLTQLSNGVTNFSLFTSGSKKASDGINLVASGAKVASNLLGVLGNMAQAIGQAFAPIFESIGKQVMDVVSTISKALSKSGGLDFNKLLNAGLMVSIIKLVQKFGTVMDNLVDSIKNIGSPMDGLKDHFTGLIDSMTDSLKAMTNSVKADTLVKIAAGTLLLAASLQILSNIKNEDVFKSLEIFGAILLMVNMNIKSFASIAPTGIASMLGAATAMDLLAGAVMVLATAVFVLSKIKPEEMIVGLSGLAGMLTMVTAAMIVLGKNKTASISAAAAIAIVANSVLVMAGALAVMSAISFGGLMKGIVGIGAILIELSTFVAIVNNSKLSVSTAAGVVLVSGAVVIMAAAVAAMGMLPTDNMVAGLAAMTAVLLALAGFTQIVKPNSLIQTGAGLVLISSSLNIMAIGIAGLGALDSNTLAQGLLGMGASLLILVAAMNGAQGGIVGAAAVTIMAVAMNLLVPPLAALGAMGLPAIGAALLGLAGAFTVIGVAGLLLAPLVPAILSLSVGIMALSASAALAGAGMLMFGTGLGIVAASGGAAILAIATGLDMLVDSISRDIPKIIKTAEQFVVGFVTAIADAAPQLANAGLQMILGFMQAILNNIPQMVATGMQIVTALANAIAANIGPLITAATTLILNFANGLAQNMDKIIQAGINLINAFANGIRQNQDEIVSTVLNVVESVLEVVITALTKVIGILFGWIPGVKGAMQTAGSEAKGALRDAFDIDTTAKEKTDEFNKNLASGAGGASSAGMTLAQAAKGGIDLADFAPAGTQKGNDFANGLLGPDGRNGNPQGATLAQNAQNGINSVPLGDTGANKGNEFSGGLASTVGGAGTAGQTIAQAANFAAGGVDTNTTGTNKGNEFANGVSSTVGNGQGAGNIIANAANAGANSVSLNGTGNSKGNEFAGGVSSVSNAARQAGNTLTASANGGAASLSLNGTGSNKGNEFKGGLSSTDTYGAGKKLADHANNGMSSADTYSTGSHAGKGFFDGLSSWGRSIADKASEIASSISTKARKALDIHSPSRVMRGIGEFAGQGLVLGLQDQMDNVGNVASDMANAAISGLSDLGQQIQDGIGTLNLDASVTPVVDMSNMQTLSAGTIVGAGAYNPMLGSAGQVVQQQTIDNSTKNVTNNITIEGYNHDPQTLASEIEAYIAKNSFI